MPNIVPSVKIEPAAIPELPDVVGNAKGEGAMPPKPETLLALSHSEESGESLGVLGAAALLERSRQNLLPEM